MNTETPHPPLSNAEAVQILTDGLLLASLTPRQKDAVLRAVHLVSRRSAQKERNERNRMERVTAPETNPAASRRPRMSDTPETLAAIVAEMRDGIHTGRADIIDCVNDRLRSYADRIEAAAERERDEDRQLAAIAESDEAFARCARCDRPERAPGNAAAMRDAILAIKSVNDRRPHDAAGYEINDIIEEALAAPARNCDRPFRLFEEAIGAYVLERGDGPHLGYCDAIKWALAPAEGGAE